MRFPTHAPKLFRDQLIAGGQARTPIHQKQHPVRLFHGLQRLLGHGAIDAHLFPGQAPGIDEDQAASRQLRRAVLAIPGEPGQIGHKRVSASGQAVK